MNPVLEYESTMNISQPPPARHPDHARTSLAFRVLVTVVTCPLVVLGLASLQDGSATNPLTWAAALLAGGCVFVLADVLLAFLVVGIPPGLFVLSLIGLLMH
jgi:hypothetical protein